VFLQVLAWEDKAGGKYSTIFLKASFGEGHESGSRVELYKINLTAKEIRNCNVFVLKRSSDLKPSFGEGDGSRKNITPKEITNRPNSFHSRNDFCEK